MVPEAGGSVEIVDRPKIFLLYPYYWPHYKAGGPVQSLFNLVSLFKDDAEFYLVSNLLDIDGMASPIPVAVDQWNHGPNGEHIYYTNNISFSLLNKLIGQIRPDTIFVNGLFNWNVTVPGVLIAKRRGINLVISPRGMLQAWGLKRNRLVKKVYLTLLRLILRRDENWHATDQQEQEDIIKNFGKGQQISIALNIPKTIGAAEDIEFPSADNKIKLVFLSLINPNKNLHLIIQALQKAGDKFSLDIYGPVIDQAYWQRCQSLINSGAAAQIQYHGSIPAWEVISKLKQFHFFVLPTQGENFGHAIFDALSCGVPVLISKFTPWKAIEQDGAGYYFDLTDSSLAEILRKLAELTPAQFLLLKKNSLDYTKRYWESVDYRAGYSFLFR